jgi:hypothetical protein
VSTNFFFNNFQSSQEQLLIEDLVIESIRIYGLDCWYVPRVLVNKDKIYGEDSLSEFKKSYMVEMYVKNVEGFAGEGDFLSKFNVEIRDQITLTIARRTFENEVLYFENSFSRPREGDLIFLPLNNKVFQIKFVEHEPVFYQMGSLQMYDLKCELFEYSNEKMNTGIQAMDELENKYSDAMNAFAIFTENGFEITMEDGYSLINEEYDLEVQDVLSDNFDVQTESDDFLDFSEADPFSEGGRY